jgi:hypothetical protein
MVDTCFGSYKIVSQDKGIITGQSCNSQVGVIMAQKRTETSSHSIMFKKIKKFGLTILCLYLNH